MSYSSELQTRPGVACLKPVEQPVRLEQPADSGWGDELHTRQQRSRSAALQGVLARLSARQQGSAADVKDFKRLVALQQASAAAGRQGAPEQDSANVVKAFLRDAALQHSRNGALLLKLNAIVDSAAAVGQQSHLLEAGLREFSVDGFADTRDARMFAGDALAHLRKLPVPEPSVLESLNQSNASSDFFEQLQAMIGLIRKEYLAVYEALLKKYSDFYAEFNRDIMAEMSKWITSSGDGKTVTINRGLLTAIGDLLTKYSAQPTGMLFPIPDKDGNWPVTSEDDAKKWAEAMGMGKDSPNVQPDGKGGYIVMMDLSPLKTMDDALRPLFSGAGIPVEAHLDSAKFQAWQTGFNNQEGELKNRLQLITTKYGNANSYHENFNKILSSQLSQYAEMLKAIASGIA